MQKTCLPSATNQSPSAADGHGSLRKIFWISCFKCQYLWVSRNSGVECVFLRWCSRYSGHFIYSTEKGDSRKPTPAATAYSPGCKPGLLNISWQEPELDRKICRQLHSQLHSRNAVHSQGSENSSPFPVKTLNQRKKGKKKKKKSQMCNQKLSSKIKFSTLN